MFRSPLPVLIVLAALTNSAVAEETVGKVKAVRPNQLVITDPLGKKDQTFGLTPMTKITLPERAGTIKDVKVGYRVQVQYFVKGTTRTATEIVVQGLRLDIVRVLPDKLMVKDAKGKEFALKIEPNARIKLNGQEKRLAELRPGDKASVIVDDKADKAVESVALRIEAQSGAEDRTTPVEDELFLKVKVFYGTDRNPVDASAPEPAAPPSDGLSHVFAWGLGISSLLMVLLIVCTLIWDMEALRHVRTLAAAAALLFLVLLIVNQPAPPDPGKLQRVGFWFGSERGPLTYGWCDVSIPKSHQHAELEAPDWRKGEFKEDPAQHVMLHDVEALTLDKFAAELRLRVKGSSKKEAFVFIHGFNVSFEDAARRTGQLAYDLKFEGAPLFFSWPSQGLFLRYTVDEANAEWATVHLRDFLREVAKKSDAEVIHLIAHSMGNRVLTRALQSLAATDGKDAPRFHQIILAAPDIDADTFRNEIHPAIKNAGKRLTLYASSRDRALQLSKQVHGSPRAGESGPDIMLLPDLDTIDVSSIDTSLLGHSYYGDNSSVVSDAFYLLQQGLPPAQRARLRGVPEKSPKHWVFEP